MKYSLDYANTVYYTVIVDANSEEEAESLAEEELEERSGFYEVGADGFLLEGCSEIED